MRNRIKHINLLVWVVACLIWQVISIVRIENPELRDMAALRILILICSFGLSLTFSNKNIIFSILTILGATQALYAIVQQIGIAESNHIMFNVTGFMGNPGQLGGFQSVALMSALFLLQDTHGKTLSYRAVLISASLIISYSLFLADSRAAFLSCIFGAFILYQRQFYDFIKCHKWFIYLAVIITIIGCISIFFYRPNSALARLLIWRVCTDMIADNPFCGHGTLGFNSSYMLYQADFFLNHPDSIFIQVADNAAYPYNEFLHILVEQGFVGLFLFLMVLLSACIKASDFRQTAPLVSLLIFSFFSYPSYKLPLAILFPIHIGVLFPHSEKPFLNKVHIWIPLILLCIGVMSAQQLNNRQHRYYQEINIISEDTISSLLPTCENWCNIGEYYLHENDHITAQKYLKQAALMIPTRVRPNYLLWKSYIETNDITKAQQIGRHILTQPIKVENTFTLRAKKEIKDWFAYTP